MSQMNNNEKFFREKFAFFEPVPHPSPDKCSNNRIVSTSSPSNKQLKSIHSYLNNLRSETHRSSKRESSNREESVYENNEEITQLMRKRINELEKENNEFKMLLWDREEVVRHNQILQEQLQNMTKSELKNSKQTNYSPHILISTPTASFEDEEAHAENEYEHFEKEPSVRELKIGMNDLEEKIMNCIVELNEKVTNIQNVLLPSEKSTARLPEEKSPEFYKKKSSIFSLQSSLSVIKSCSLLKQLLECLTKANELFSKFNKTEHDLSEYNEIEMKKIEMVLKELQISYNSTVKISNLTIFEGQKDLFETNQTINNLIKEYEKRPPVEFWEECEESKNKLTIILEIIQGLNEEMGRNDYFRT